MNRIAALTLVVALALPASASAVRLAPAPGSSDAVCERADSERLEPGLSKADHRRVQDMRERCDELYEVRDAADEAAADLRETLSASKRVRADLRRIRSALVRARVAVAKSPTSFRLGAVTFLQRLEAAYSLGLAQLAAEAGELSDEVQALDDRAEELEARILEVANGRQRAPR